MTLERDSPPKRISRRRSSGGNNSAHDPTDHDIPAPDNGGENAGEDNLQDQTEGVGERDSDGDGGQLMEGSENAPGTE
jgi:hypothetical protein